MIIVILLTGLLAACRETPAPPPGEQPQAATLEAQAVQPGQTATEESVPSEPLPPLIVGTTPALGEEQPLEAPVEIVFDQPMDRASVERAFAIEPGASVDGEFTWPDDTTVQFKLNEGFERGQRYKVRLVGSAESAEGLALGRDFELRFSAAGFLEIANVQPGDEAMEILPDTTVTVTFNRPVVPLNAIEQAGASPDPLTFTPAVAGQGRWLNTSIYQFTPDEGFKAATPYTARIAAGLTDALDQAILEDDYTWTFTTVAPAVAGSYPASGDLYVSPSPVISVTFNQPMDRASVEEKLALVNDATGETVSGDFSWVDGPLQQPQPEPDQYGYYDYAYDEGAGPEEVGVETVEFRPAEPLEPDTVYRVELPEGAKGRIGQAETMRDFSAAFTVAPLPTIVKTFPANGDRQVEPWQSLQITFSTPMKPESLVLGQNLVISPRVSATQVYSYWWSSNTELEINFPSKAGTRYQVRIGPGLESRYGQTIDVPTLVAWETRAQSPMVFMHTADRIATYNAYTDTLTYVTVRNASRVDFSLYRLPLDDFINLNGENWWEAWDAYHGAEASLLNHWTLEVKAELDSNVIYRVDLGDRSGLGDKLPPGLYYLEANIDRESIFPEAEGGSDPYNLRARQMLVVSQNNLTLKTSNDQMLAWLTDLDSGQPVADLPVSFLSPTGADLGRAVTGLDGVAATDHAPIRDSWLPRFAVVGDPADPDETFAVATNQWSNGIERYAFDNILTEDYLQPYTGQFYTERQIYRPGQTVYFKGIIRGDDDARYSLPAGQETVEVIVMDSQGKEILRDDFPISAMGTVNGEIVLDENAALGFYSMEIKLTPEIAFYDDFQVAAYRRPEFLVSVETDKPEYAQGEAVKVTANAEFYFGGAVSNAKVQWTLLSADYTFVHTPPPGASGGWYEFTDYDTSRSQVYYSSFGETIAEGSGVTDSEGRFTFEVEADIADKIASQRFTFDVTVTDLNNQVVASQAEAIVHKGEIYVGLRPDRYVYSANQQADVHILTVDWDSQPVGNQEVEVVFAEHNWYSVQKQYEDGSFYWDSEVETIPVFTTTVTTASDGAAIAGFKPSQGGLYRVMARAEDAKGNEVRSSTFMWVSGSEYVNWRQENNDRIALVADKREYEVGDTATVLVPHPYSGTVQALVTLERGHIYDHFTVELATNSEQLEIPITEDMIPNMYVSVVVVQGASSSLLGAAPASLLAEGAEGGPIPGLPSFKVGYASLPIDAKEKELQITLTPSPSEGGYQPGDTVEYFVNVTDYAGQPVEAELSLALVDKAVLSLAPEAPGQLLSTFWRDRGLGVQTSGGLALAIDRINLAIAPEAKGGGGGFDEGYGDIRGEFKDTALWIADFKTDEQGTGVVEAELPDNLTTWTLTGKGVTGAETLVGESVVEIVSTKPLLVRPVVPRFFVVGDEAQMGLIVQNNAQETLTVEVRFEGEGLEIGEWRLGDQETGDWQANRGAQELTVKAGERIKVEYQVEVTDVDQVKLTMGAKGGEFGDALALDVPVYKFSTPETVATVGSLSEDGTRTEGIALPDSLDATQGNLTINLDPSLASGMRHGLDYLEHFAYECTEQTVSRFLPNVFTYRAYKELKLERPDLEQRLPALVSLGLQRLYNQQHTDGGWGWFIRDDSQPFLSAYVLLGLIEADRAGFAVDEGVISTAVSYLEGQLVAPKDIEESWHANRQAFILYVLAEAGYGDLGRSVALFNERQKLDYFGRAYLAMAIHLLDDEADQIDTLLNDLTSGAIASASGAHWEEAQVDYFSMNTDTRSTAIIIAALSRIQPENPILPNAVRWLMTVREKGGHWETTQETAWAIIGLTDWMVATGELEGNYEWRVSLNGESLGEGVVEAGNIDQTTELRVEVGDLLAEAVNRLAISRDPAGSAVEGSPGQLYYAAYLTYFKPVPEVKALDRGIIVSREYTLAEDDASEDASAEDASAEDGKPITQAKVGDVINVKLTLIAPNDLHYVLVEDPFPAGAEGIDTSLATTSVVGQAPELERTDRRRPWAWGWWYFSHSELRDEKAVLFATFLPKGTYQYTYQIRASLPGKFNIIPTHAEEMYFPEVFGRSDGALFEIQ
jgi:hypothetical protein